MMEFLLNTGWSLGPWNDAMVLVFFYAMMWWFEKEGII